MKKEKEKKLLVKLSRIDNVDSTVSWVATMGKEEKIFCYWCMLDLKKTRKEIYYCINRSRFYCEDCELDHVNHDKFICKRKNPVHIHYKVILREEEIPKEEEIDST